MSDSAMEPELKDFPACRVIAMDHRGRHDDIGEVYRGLAAWAESHGVKIAGPGMTVFLSPANEAMPETALYRVCLPIEGDARAEGDVRVLDLPTCKAYAYLYQGPYSAIGAKYTELMAWVSAQGWQPAGPPFEIYRRHPMPDGSVPPNEYLTEICAPVSV